MTPTPSEVIIAYLASLLLWVLAFAVIWFAGQRLPSLKAFREGMISQWKAAAVIAAVYAASVALRGPEPNLFSMLSGGAMTFCQAIIGLGLARRIAGFEPVPVGQAIVRRERVGRNLLWMIGVALLAVAASILAGALGTGLARALGEIKPATQGSETALPPLWQLFFHFLSGAGIAEETVYRLVVVSLVWGLTQRRWAAMLLSSLLFGAYHLTPLTGMYLTFWQYPLTQFLSSALIGVVWAYTYMRRGHETAVLAHTLSDWLPAAVFVAFSG